ncbi:hypothetical protein Y695_01696 [Hydrogenophaga sp. T4]|nr:hypothetical protein Y695_01696 [Hydrogenophaga sp. T4]
MTTWPTTAASRAATSIAGWKSRCTAPFPRPHKPRQRLNPDLWRSKSTTEGEPHGRESRTLPPLGCPCVCGRHCGACRPRPGRHPDLPDTRPRTGRTLRTARPLCRPHLPQRPLPGHDDQSRSARRQPLRGAGRQGPEVVRSQGRWAMAAGRTARATTPFINPSTGNDRTRSSTFSGVCPTGLPS